MDVDGKYQVAAQAINNAGGTPLPITETLISILKHLIKEDELDFVAAFKDQKSQTMDQLKQSSGLPESEILGKTAALAKRGVIFDQPNRAGVMVYRLLPLINVGMFEYTYMKKLEHSDLNKELARLFTKLFEEITDIVQANYDDVMAIMEHTPAIDRTIPVLENKATGKKVTIEINEQIGAVENIVPKQRVEEIIAKFDEIAVGHCFCRHYKDLVGKSCKQTDIRENCFTFGKSARYTSSQGFSRMITREEALEILKKSEEDGLVHKAYHPNFDIMKDETSICTCCSCCCGQAEASLIGPTANAAYFLAKVDLDICVGCGTCAERCHTDAVKLDDDNKPSRIENLCIGCGTCAYFCPENAISLVEGPRTVRIAPPRRQ